ncbi:hypothetical protein M0R72_10130 [Candidatus Pacearchaeota archaeon]|jgi:hypothetical protein|nr:hypothetical protein [Candidatus Pacearchaeota archaeon]
MARSKCSEAVQQYNDDRHKSIMAIRRWCQENGVEYEDYEARNILEATLLGLEEFQPNKNTLPTTAKPGTKSKVEVMAERVARGEELHQEGDEVYFASVADLVARSHSLSDGVECWAEPEEDDL